jgi:hypothetical protein
VGRQEQNAREMNPRLFIPLLASVALCATSMAANYGGASPAPLKPRVVVHHHTVIDTITNDSITITDAAGSHTFKITAQTEITFKGSPATASSLAAGMRVQVTPDAVDPDTASQIAADDPPKDPTPRPKPGKN